MMRVLFWSNTDHETECQMMADIDPADPIIVTALMYNPERVTESSRRWPAFGDSGEQTGYYFANSDHLFGLARMYDLTVETVSS